MQSAAHRILHAICPRLTPGASLLVAREREILLHQGYGWADVEQAVPARAETAYLIASITKQFVCVAAMLAAEAKKLDIDAPIARYVPDLPAWSRVVSTRHLMTHTSGIPDYFTDRFIAEYCRDDSAAITQADLVRYIAEGYPELDFAPGERWAYSNSGYVILGELIERTGDLSLPDLLKARIFGPLGMENTRMAESADRPAGMATGYRPADGGGFAPAPYNRTVVGWADGNIISTCGDLFRWQLACHDGEILPPKAWRQLFTPHRCPNGRNIPYGMGWFVWQRRGLTEWWHTGGTVGYQGRAAWFPEAGAGVILLMNADPGSIGDLNLPCGGLIHAALAQRLTPLPAFRPLPAGTDRHYLGEWDERNGEKTAATRFQIRRDQTGRLILSGSVRGSTGEWPLLPEASPGAEDPHPIRLWLDSDADYVLTTGNRDAAAAAAGEAPPETLTLHCHGRKVYLVRPSGSGKPVLDAPE